jgi:hypothetical protein
LRSPRRALVTAAIAAVAYLPWVALYQALYGNPLGPATIVMNATQRGLWYFGRLKTLVGVLFSPARGLFVYQPWAILALAPLLPCVGRKADTSISPAAPRGWAGFCAVAIAIHAVLISSWHDWSGGWCWGSRLMTDVLPLLGLLCVTPIAALGSSRNGRRFLIGIGILGILPHIPGAFLGSATLWNAASDQANDLWSWSRAPFLCLSRGALRG